MHDTLTIGITFDTRKDFKFEHDDPWDWDIELQVSMSVDDISRALEDLGHKTVLIGSGTTLVDNFSKHKNEVDLVFNIAEGRFGGVGKGRYLHCLRWQAFHLSVLIHMLHQLP